MVLDPVITAAFGSAAVAAASALDPPRKPSEASWCFKLGLCIVAWFASSALCSFGTKNTLNSLAPQSCAVGLTTLQFTVSAVIGGAICLVTRQSLPPGCWFDMGRIALVYTLGFLFFNMSYGRLAASFAETVRGLEPLFSFAFVRLLGVRGGMLRAPSAVALATLLVGGVMSCASQAFDARGLAFGLASNCCFAARSIYVSMLQDRLKRERAAGPPIRGGMGAPLSSSSQLPPHATAARYELSSSTVFFYQHLLGLLLMVPCSLLEDSRRAAARQGAERGGRGRSGEGGGGAGEERGGRGRSGEGGGSGEGVGGWQSWRVAVAAVSPHPA